MECATEGATECFKHAILPGRAARQGLLKNKSIFIPDNNNTIVSMFIIIIKIAVTVVRAP